MAEKDILLEKAQKGDVGATLACGWCCMFGYKGFQQDMSKAREWLEKAKDLGSIDALRCIGYICEKGCNFYDAVDYYEQGALRGDMQSGFIALSIMKSRKLEMESSKEQYHNEIVKLGNMITEFEKRFDEILEKIQENCK